MVKRAAVFTDISGLGNCSGNANIAILAALGVETCLVPTAILSAQTGFKNFYMHNFSGHIGEYVSSLKKISPRFDVIYSGFLSNIRQCECAAELIAHFRNTGAAVLVDPITGDGGERYHFLTDIVFKKIQSLALGADIITPNLTELCLLSHGSYKAISSMDGDEKTQEIVRLCRSIMNDTLKTVVVTGVDCGEFIANVTVGEDRYSVAAARRFGGSMSGTGDILASVVCAAAANGEDIHKAVSVAADFISSVMEREYASIADRNYGIPYQKYLRELILKHD